MAGMKYQVTDYVVDTALYRISRAGEAIPVEPKVFNLLVYLIRHRDRVLARDELFQEVWDGREVSDATLSNHVKTARKVLGDSGERQKTILTIRGRGYQFIAPVTEIPDGARSPAKAEAPFSAEDEALATPAVPPIGKPAAPAWRPFLGLGVLLLAAVVIGWRVLAPHAPPNTDLPYLVVVPFDVSGDAPEVWQPFADQVTREVIRNLRKISGLRVVPTPSAFTFRDNKSPEHIRRQLPDAQYVLDGVVSVSADKALRITAELEDLNQDRLVWDKDFQGRIDDTNLFAMQSGIAEAVSASLKVVILKDEHRALSELPTNNLKAYELYVAGRQEMELFSHESLPRAIDLFNQAIALDPQFFAAHIARSDAYRSLFGYFEPPIKMLPAVVSSLSEALELRPDSAEALSSLGLTYVMAWRWKDAWTVLNAAKSRDPTLALTELGFALYYSGLGEAEKVKSSLAAANRLDPLNPEIADWGNWALFMVGEKEAARAWGEEKMRQHPNIGILFCGAGVSAYLAGDYERSITLAERGVAMDRSPVALIMLAQAYGYAGQRDKVKPLLDEAASNGAYICPYESAAAYLSIGDKERAIALLNEAFEKRSNCLIFLRNDPRMSVLRDDPRYAVLLTRVGLDDTALASYKR
jgi:DNA-binding winged helix-turn-helix (wHTH) protein/TolB-like protein/tetratricopeptide (TPR) repeat protein